MDLPVHLALFQWKGVEEKKLEPGMQSTGGRRFNTLCPYSTTTTPPPPPLQLLPKGKKGHEKNQETGITRCWRREFWNLVTPPPPSLLLSCKMSVAVTYHNTSSQHDPFTHLPYHWGILSGWPFSSSYPDFLTWQIFYYFHCKHLEFPFLIRTCNSRMLSSMTIYF